MVKDRILITGHLGYIGQNLMAELRSRAPFHIYTLDWRDDPSQNILTAPLPEVHACYHLAAQTDARAEDPIADARTNILGSIRIFQAYRDHCVYTSSSAVNYPVTPYAISKLAAEHYAKLFNVRTVRLCNVFGRGGHGVIDNFRRHDVMEVCGDGSQIRTYAHIGSVIDALVHPPEPGAVRILKGVDKTVKELADEERLAHPHKSIRYRRRSEHDIQDGRQIYLTV